MPSTLSACQLRAQRTTDRYGSSIEQVKSSVDKDGDGIDDQTDILEDRTDIVGHFRMSE